MNIRKNKIILTFIFISFILLGNRSSYANNNKVRTLVGDFANPVFDISLSDGATLFDLEENILKRKEINDKIFLGESNKEYSLYDRFGPNLSFIPYYGEFQIEYGLIDLVYTKLSSNTDSLISWDTLWEILEGRNIKSNNQVYANRPSIISGKDIQAGYQDPRVSRYSAVQIGAGTANVANFNMMMSNFGTTLTGELSGSSIFNNINNIWNKLINNNSVKAIMNNLFKFLMPLLILVSVLKIALDSRKVITGQLNSSIRQFFTRLINYFISLILIYFFIGNPSEFIGTTTKIITIFDTVVDSELSKASDNEVVKSDDPENVRKAMLWYKSIFEPWSKGMFGDDYKNLYTNYESKLLPNQKIMKQSNEDLDATFDENQIKYNSTHLIGDIRIPIGNNKYIRNWAALAYSTQSKYHINAIKDEMEQIEQTEEEKKSGILLWPRSTTTIKNQSIYIDNFRWLDAILDVSPEYYSSSEAINNYTASRAYKEDFGHNSRIMIYRTLLMFPILILSIIKIFKLFSIASSAFRWMIYSVKTFINPDKYDIGYNFKKVIEPIYHYFWYSILIMILVLTYYNLMNKSILADIMWIIFSIYIMSFRPNNVTKLKEYSKSAYYWSKNKIINMKDSFKEKITRKRF